MLTIYIIYVLCVRVREGVSIIAYNFLKKFLKLFIENLKWVSMLSTRLSSTEISNLAIILKLNNVQLDSFHLEYKSLKLKFTKLNVV